MKTEKDEAMRRELVSKGAVLDMLEEMERFERRLFTSLKTPESFGALGMIFRASAQVETMKAEPAARWVPLRERKPETHKDVLVSLDNGEVLTGWRYDEEDGCWFLGTGDANAGDDEIRAWAPLPEPYMEAKE